MDVPKNILDSVEEIHAAIDELIAIGARNFLWYWRNPLLLQWRRGVRGLEYSTLAVIIREIKRRLNKRGNPSPDRQLMFPETINPSRLEEELKEIQGQLIPFCEKAKHLLIKERLYIMKASLSPVECADVEISHLRHELFGLAMSHGGHFKRLIDPMDRMLYGLIKEE